ncbi:MAG: hypothetical protein RIR39_764, partial [Pseudomonadota bacterium]
KLGYEFLILGMFYRLGNYLSPVLKNESLVIRGLQILFNYYLFLGHDGVMFRGQFRLILQKVMPFGLCFFFRL